MPPIPASISDLSTTAASNYPQGTDSPSTLDDVQRAHGSFIRQLQTGAVATTANVTAGAINGATVGATTPSTGAFTTLSATGATVTKASAGDVATFTNGGATPKPIIAYSTSAYSGLYDGAGATGQGITFDATGGTVQIQTGSTTRGNFSSTGLSVTGALSSTGNITFGSGGIATLSSNAANYLFLNAPTGYGVYSTINGSTITQVTASGLAVTGALSATGNVSSNGASSGTGAGGGVYAQNGGSTTVAFGGYSALLGGAYNATPTIYYNGNLNIYNGVGAATAATLDTSGNLGLGVTPSAWNGFTGMQVGALGSTNIGGSVDDNFIGSNVYYNANWFFARPTTATYASMYRQSAGSHKWFSSTAGGTAGNVITWNTAMTLDASGNLLWGTTTATSSPANGITMTLPTTGSNMAIGHASGTASGVGYIGFAYNSTNIGGITQSGTTAVLYNTTSDYRLKDVVGPVTGSGARLDALNPVEYTWKADGTHTRGFLAHEFQSVYAQSVNGTKDEVDEEGNPKYQSMQAGSSEVIADLVAEIKSLRARLAAAGL